MEEEKNLERREFVGEGVIRDQLKNLSLRNTEDPGFGESLDLPQRSDTLGESEDDDLAENLLQSFSSDGDDDLLQKEYDMVSSCNMSEALEDRSETVGADGDILNGVYFDRLELELSSIERAMMQFEGRLDLLREQAQDLLQTIQHDRSVAKADTDQYSAGDSEAVGSSGSVIITHGSIRLEQGDGAAAET